MIKAEVKSMNLSIKNTNTITIKQMFHSQIKKWCKKRG